LLSVVYEVVVEKYVVGGIIEKDTNVVCRYIVSRNHDVMRRKVDARGRINTNAVVMVCFYVVSRNSDVRRTINTARARTLLHAISFSSKHSSRGLRL